MCSNVLPLYLLCRCDVCSMKSTGEREREGRRKEGEYEGRRLRAVTRTDIRNTVQYEYGKVFLYIRSMVF